ncbi:MAG: hypothetical protein EOP48_08105, partial [Sphingobacteriales bacterium]
MKIFALAFLSVSLSSSAFAAVSREHCKTSDDRSACFIEIEDNGKSEFFTSSEDYSLLALDGQLASLNVEFTELPLVEYKDLY